MRLTLDTSDCTSNVTMLPVQRHAEKLFVNFIQRLQPLAHDHHLALIDVIRIAREMVQDSALLTQIASDENCVHAAELGQILDIRTQHFKRYVLHQFILASGIEKQDVYYEQTRFWLLHLIELTEIALGQFRFQEAQHFCETWIEEQKNSGHFNFHHFLNSETIKQLYVALIFQLAIFLEGKPKHRIRWLLHSMESNPTSRIEFGVEIHVSNAIEPPTQQQTLSLLVEIYEKLLQYTKLGGTAELLKQKFPQLAIEPIELVEQLLLDLKSGVGKENE